MAELLLEVLSEEVPARMQARATDDLRRLVCDTLSAAGLGIGEAAAFATPRRLGLVVDGLPERQPDRREERKGPQVGAPERAIEGFLRSAGVTLEQCEQREVKGKSFWFAVIDRKGEPTDTVLAEALPAALARLPWPKSMRWGAGDARWVRPIHSILCLFAGRKVGFAFAGSTAGDETAGHRFLAPGRFAVRDFADYRTRLREAYVMLDGAERAEVIDADARRLAEAEGLTLRDDPGLLAEVAGLVEWPVPLIGAIDAGFMDLPPEVLTESMRAHQKYFALDTADGTLAPRFITVANMLTEDGGAAVVAGNERVLRARLSDARFFWDQDRKRKLESRVAALQQMTFHEKLGTVADKVDRMESLATAIAAYVPGADKDMVRSAAHLAKADLVTGMVGEFPELQGIMGRYYALHDGESPEVADAVAAHYSPKGPNDSCPSAPVSVAVALADKVDSLVGFFAVDEKPTGSRDPFALRRAALGVIRIITENGLRLPLNAALAAAEAGYRAGSTINNTLDSSELLGFFADRLKVQMREKGVRHDLIAAVFALGGEDDLVRLLARVEALAVFLGTEDGANLLTAYNRAANIVAIEEKKDRTTFDGPVAETLLAEPDERRLFEVLEVESGALPPLLRDERFTDAMTALAQLRRPVDAFFDNVTVNCDDPRLRENRLRLLARIRATLNQVADFSKIEG